MSICLFLIAHVGFLYFFSIFFLESDATTNYFFRGRPSSGLKRRSERLTRPFAMLIISTWLLLRLQTFQTANANACQCFMLQFVTQNVVHCLLECGLPGDFKYCSLVTAMLAGTDGKWSLSICERRQLGKADLHRRAKALKGFKQEYFSDLLKDIGSLIGTYAGNTRTCHWNITIPFF